VELLGVFRFGDLVGVFFHRAAGVPDVEAQLFVLAVDHRQADAAIRIRFAPAEQRRQRVELALDRPVSADRALRAAHQPYAQHLLQVHGALMAIHHRLALGLELAAQQRLVFGRFEGQVERQRHVVKPTLLVA
jgi:hypothetical protein